MSAVDFLDKSMPILIVDDFGTMRRILKNTLKELGFENITEAEDGLIALRKLDAAPYGLVISDWNMPNMMGAELLEKIRNTPHLSDLPFLMVTAEGQKESVIEAAKAGVSSCIVKPFTAPLLKKKIEEVFAQKAAL